MTGFDAFWDEFQSEADEHVVTADRLIEQARSSALGGGEISELFRAFHSLKGLAHAMDLGGMEGLAHRSESLLGLVRDRGVPFDDDLLQGLGLAVDHLGRMMAEIARDRQDVAAEEALLARLDRLYADRRGESVPESEKGQEAPVDAGQSGGEMVSLLAELMGQFLPSIAGLAAPSLDADAASGRVDSALALGNAAAILEMPELAEIVAGLSAFSSGAAPDSQKIRLALLARLAQQAALVGDITGVDSGVRAFAEELAPSAAGPIRVGLERLGVDFARLLGSAEADAGAAWPPVISGAAEVGYLLGAIGHGRSAGLLALVSETAGVAARGDLPALPAVSAGIGAAIALLSMSWSDPASVPPDLSEAAAGERASEIRDALSMSALGEEPVESDEPKIADLALPAEFLPVLSIENRRQVERAIAEGQLAYRILIDIDDTLADDSGGLLGKLAEIGQSITSRTVMQGTRTLFEFLTISPLSHADMRAALAALDPRQRQVKSVQLAIGGQPSADPAESRRTAAPEAASSGDSSMLRVRSVAIDRLMAAIGHARVSAATLSQILIEDRRRADAVTGLQKLRDRLPAAAAAELGRYLAVLREREDELEALDGRLATALSQLHTDALDLRVVPVDTVLGHLPRVAREIAQRQGKAIRIRLKGRDVRIDKSVVQQLLDPLMHMMRNSVDHGIEMPADRAAAGKPETATITLRARQRSSEFRLEVSDDGRGLNAEAIRRKAIERGLVGEAESRELPPDSIYRFIFEPGFSTAAAITETSGRGVGMDVVMHTVTRLGGRIDIQTELGVGTTFVLRLPLTAAVLPALLVEVAGQSLAIPERHIVAVEEITQERVRHAGGRRVLLRGNLALPLYPLASMIGMGPSIESGGHAVVVASGAASIALVVDRLLRRQELLLRDLHPALAALPGVGGAALLGDGSPVLVLDVDVLIELARSGGRRRAARADRAS